MSILSVINQTYQNFSSNMQLFNKSIPPILKRFTNSRASSGSSDFQKSVQVSIVGANTRLGLYTSFLIKQNPLVSQLHLQGCVPVEQTSVDLNFLDTRCNVKSYCGTGQRVVDAIKGGDIVLILPTEGHKPDETLGERIVKEGKRVHNIAEQCAMYAPRAILVVCVAPVSVMTPLVTEVFKKTNFYHPGRIVGSAAIAQVKANTLLGRFQDLDPTNCYVPLSGGPDLDLVVPLFSKAKPVEVFADSASKNLVARIRGVPESEFPKKSGNPDFVDQCALAESHALNQLVGVIALGLCGDPKACANVHLRSKVLETCKYLVSTVRFSRGGVVHNYGIPTLTDLEMGLVEKAALQLKDREQMALDFLDFIASDGNKEDEKKGPPFTQREQEQKAQLKKKIIR